MKVSCKGLLAAVLGSLIVSACANGDYETASRPSCQNYKWNYVVADVDGQSVCDIERHIKDMAREIHGGAKHLVVFAHGGLVTEQDIRQRAAKIESIATKHGIQPVFLIWRTGPVETYLDETFRLNTGEVVKSNWLPPVAIAEHLIDGAARVPMTTVTQARRVLDIAAKTPEFDVIYPQAGYPAVNRYCASQKGGAVSSNNNVLFACKNQQAWDAGCKALGESAFLSTCDLSGGRSASGCIAREEERLCQVNEFSRDWTNETVQYLLSTPARVTLSGPINGLGQAAWTNMLRRTRNTIRQAKEFDPAYLSQQSFLQEMETYPAGTGAFARLFSALQDIKANSLQTRHAGNYSSVDWSQGWANIVKEKGADLKMDFRLTLIGHSMGTIVFNEILSAFPNLGYDDIVYMAAAASILEVSQSVAPVLRSPFNLNARFFNLMLHPLAEAREINRYGAVPSGSLLKWIDEIYGRPLTPRDRTAGAWSNIRAAKFSFPRDVQNKTVFKVFGLGVDDPIKHGHFSERCFWDANFWITRDFKPKDFWPDNAGPGDPDDFRKCTDQMMPQNPD